MVQLGYWLREPRRTWCVKVRQLPVVAGPLGRGVCGTPPRHRSAAQVTPHWLSD